MHIQKNFEDQVVKREEEERETKLRELKQSRQPVSRSGIAAHQQKYQDILRQKKEQLKNQRDGLGYGSADNVNKPKQIRDLNISGDGDAYGLE